MEWRPTNVFPEVLILEPDVYRDKRGIFSEMYCEDKYREAGIEERFVQDNFSYSKKRVLRGLHYQLERPQGKLIYVLQGKIFDVAVDIRVGSPTFGEWVGITLSSENFRQIYIPGGFAHGFCVLSRNAHVCYKCSDYYDPASEYGLLWDDPEIGIMWPIEDPIVSRKDRKNPFFHKVPESSLPHYSE